MRNILAPVAIFILSGCLALLTLRFAFACFLVGASINIYVNRRKKSKGAGSDIDDRDVLLLRSSYALMLPSFIFVAVVAIGMSGVIFNRVA